jgi:hypothetical protein
MFLVCSRADYKWGMHRASFEKSAVFKHGPDLTRHKKFANENRSYRHQTQRTQALEACIYRLNRSDHGRQSFHVKFLHKEHLSIVLKEKIEQT